MILHIPHASTNTASLDIDPIAVLKTTDHFTDDLFDYPCEHRFTSAYNRNVVDLERLDHDPLEAIGQGILYRVDCHGKAIVRDSALDAQLMDYFKAHHHRLQQAVYEQIAQVGHCVLVDCHSFSNEQAGVNTAPDICIGYNDGDISYHKTLTDRVIEQFEAFGYTVGVNEPYANSMSIQDPKAGFSSLMIEVNKHCYLEIKDGIAYPSSQYDQVKQHLYTVLEMISKDESCWTHSVL